jgi:hypothetical protein
MEKIMTPTNTTVSYTNAAKYVNVLGILSIVFGSLGALAGLLFVLSSFINPDYTAESAIVAMLMIIVFWVIPHIYFIISGIKFVKYPKPGETKGLAITTVVLGAIWNLILLAFAIVVLTQLRGYEEGFEQPRQDPVPKI